MNGFKGFLLVIEGPGGSGKGTLMDKLEAWAQQRNIPYVRTREPGGTYAAEYLRKICREGIPNSPDKLEPMTEALLFNASRVENIQKVIIPALKEGKLVICDRFYHTTMAYQSRCGTLVPEQLLALHDQIHGLRPDRTLVLDGDPAIFNARISAEEKNTDQFDNLKLAELQRVRDVYRSFGQEPCHTLIDAEQNPDQVFAQVLPFLSGIDQYMFKRPVLGTDESKVPPEMTFKGSLTVPILDKEHVDNLLKELSVGDNKEGDTYFVSSVAVGNLYMTEFKEGKWGALSIHVPRGLWSIESIETGQFDKKVLGDTIPFESDND